MPVLLAADGLAHAETIWLDRSKILGDVVARVMGIITIVGIESILIPEYEGDSYTRP